MIVRELKPCPFCGGEAHLYEDHSGERGLTRWQVWHECNGFDGEFAGYGFGCRPWFDTPWYGDKETAIGAWNRRNDERTL